MSLLFTSEHELKEKFGHEGWQESLSTYSNEADIFLHYSCIESDETKAALRDFAKSLDGHLRIVVFEECVEKGGGGDNGIIPSLMEYVFNADQKLTCIARVYVAYEELIIMASSQLSNSAFVTDIS